MSLLWSLDAREAFRPSPRGIGLYQRHLMREFAHLAKDDQFLLYHQRPAPPEVLPLATNLKAKLIDIRGDRWHFWELLRLPFALWRDKPAVYHGTCNTLPPVLPCPGVVTLHDVIVLWWDEDPPDSYVRHCRRVTGRTVKSAKVVLTVSEYSKREILTRFRLPEEKVKVFYNGIQPRFHTEPTTTEIAETRAKLELTEPYIFAIGSHLRRKNTATLVTAAARLARQKKLTHRLAISGLSGPQGQVFMAQAKAEGIADRLTLLPYMDEATLTHVYAGADLFAYPSRAEGWGIPVLEAMAMGTPVICNDTTAIPEAGGDDARYCDTTNPDEMAAVIKETLENRTWWDQRRQTAQTRARSFGWEAAARTTLDAYREAAGD